MKQDTDRQWTRWHRAVLGMILLAYVLIVWQALQADPAQQAARQNLVRA